MGIGLVGFRYLGYQIVRVGGYMIHLLPDYFRFDFGLDSFGFGSVRIVKLETGKYSKNLVLIRFWSGSSSDNSG